MMHPREYRHKTNAKNATSLCVAREYGEIEGIARRRLHASSTYVDRLDQECVLKGHEGCVNCLEWSTDGRVLASGSDDFQVILWDAFRRRRLHTMRTKHVGNMFSVKFLPQHNDTVLATGAADKYIYVFDINNHDECLLSCHCHTSRVKRLATAPDSPYVFWSAGEDGVILQLDTRVNHTCRSESNRTSLINLTAYVHSNAEVKCIAINPRRTEMLAVGANDPYARIYDRRMLRTRAALGISPGLNESFVNNANAELLDAVPKDCVKYYCPGHISKNNTKTTEYEARAITYLTFNAIGTELLVNIGSDHIYLYDIIGGEAPIYLNLPDYVPPPPVEDEMIGLEVPSGEPSSSTPPTSRRRVPPSVDIHKKLGNDYLENEKYLRAIDKYSEAIAVAPQCSVLYLNRATAFMRRLWYGDVYAALRDCHQALRLEPGYIKAHFRLARALLELGLNQEAEDCLKELIQRFPSYTNNHGVLMLHKDIRENRQTAQSNQQVHEAVFSCIDLVGDEYVWRGMAKDYKQRFVGHSNSTTDIKEANFLGYDGDFIVAGSDDENFFIWERKTGNIRAIYRADTAIVNCVQPHPTICALATSGIDHDIKIWTPCAATPDKRQFLVSTVDKTVEENQTKMKTDPFDLNGRNAFCWNG